MIDKKQMTEEDIKLNFITPALIGKDWQDKITMETAVRFTDGKINLRGNIVTRKNPRILWSRSCLQHDTYRV